MSVDYDKMYRMKLTKSYDEIVQKKKQLEKEKKAKELADFQVFLEELNKEKEKMKQEKLEKQKALLQKNLQAYNDSVELRKNRAKEVYQGDTNQNFCLEQENKFNLDTYRRRIAILGDKADQRSLYFADYSNKLRNSYQGEKINLYKEKLIKPQSEGGSDMLKRFREDFFLRRKLEEERRKIELDRLNYLQMEEKLIKRNKCQEYKAFLDKQMQDTYEYRLSNIGLPTIRTANNYDFVHSLRYNSFKK